MMKKVSWIMVLLSMMILSNIHAQKPTKNKEDVYNLEDLYEDDPYFWSYTKEIGVNFTPLISKFVPFNLGQNNAGLIGLKWKKYYSKRAFRINFGANINEINVDSEENLFLYFGLGIETRHPITKDKKWAYTSSYDLFLRAQSETGILGLSKGYGFEYHFSKRIFASTEAALNFGLDLDNDIPVFEFQLPLAIFVNIRLY